ncbi:MAG: DUF4173 domain-containing protein [Bacteroidales bacterium]|nr:DUF4173 domain-containing protein [Bacteroidales bacterium]
MNKKGILIVVFLTALVFAFLFHNQPLGLNLLIFELFVVAMLLLLKQINLKGITSVIAFSSFLITAFATVAVYSFWTYFVHFIIFFLFLGTQIYPEVRSFLHAFVLFFNSSIYAPSKFVRKISDVRFKNKKMGLYLRRSRIFLLPLLVIIVFVIIYRNSNPVFDQMLINMGHFINKIMVAIFGSFDPLVFLTFFLGLLFSMIIFMQTPYFIGIENYSKKSDFFVRIRKRIRRKFSINALNNELKAGVFLFLILNLVLLVVNIIDIKWVWFNFEWSGQYLRQFVHEGTYLLIFSIILSVVLVLFFFRGNISFYNKNRFLKYLSYTWLLQNAVLAISVGIRNYWYIYYFSLAYKRIGVYMFLLLTIYCLYTVYIKVKSNKSNFYLLRQNAASLVIILVLSSVFNWDCIIARYNFNNYERSFVHLNFLSRLSSKALPYLDKSPEVLYQIDTIQKSKFPFDYRYMTPDEYIERIERKKEKFKTSWESKGVLSWNYPQYKAYKLLYEK